MEEKMRHMAQDICSAYGAKAEFEYEHRYPATINTEAESDIAAQVATSIVGKESVNLNPTPAMGSEDFAFMLQEKPGSYVWIGNGKTDSVHNPGYDFNDPVAPVGATYWVKLIETLLPPIS